jgi:LuxR family transcriptional regulator, maltose regulon positive regulatory protein
VILGADESTGRTEAPILLVTKLHAPFVPAQTVVRERLFDRLRDGRGLKLSLVACPAGFGKSTLLAAWREREARDRPVAWITLDEGDNDPVVLWSHVIEALGRECAGLAHATLAASVVSSPLLEVVLPRLVNELAEQGELVLVLDDFHRLSSSASRESVAWFVDHVPSTVQLVLSTRADPSLPLGALRAHGQLLELRADDLRFTAAEADEFLNGRLELELAGADVDLLVSRTEGWPAGIYLAALSLAGKPDKAALVRAFDGTSAHVVDFLSSEVLTAYEPELQTFMLRTSVLERLCVPLCDAVLEAPASGDALDALARSNLFLLALDDQRRWYRFHHLFAQLLRVELERREPEAVAGLHLRAFEWHNTFGTTDEAIHHAVAAGAFQEAGQLIAETWIHYVNGGRTSSVLDWLVRFPDALLDGDARLLLVKAWISALRGREDEMRRAIARVRELGGLDEGPLPDGFASLESSVSVLSAAFAWGDAGAVLAQGTRSAELEGPDSPWRPVITWSLGWGHYCRGELDVAERWFKETTVIAPEADQWVVGVAAIADLSLIAGMRGRRADQLRLATEAVDAAREHGLLEAREDGEVHTAYGVALAAHGRREEALPELEQGVFLRRLWGQPLDLVDGLIALAPAVAAAGDRERGADLFREAEELLAGCPDAGVLPVRLAAAKRAAGIGRPAKAGAELSERELGVLRLLSSGLSEREIGQELFLSFNTVHTHVKSVYRKLGVSSRADAVARARTERLI